MKKVEYIDLLLALTDKSEEELKSMKYNELRVLYKEIKEEKQKEAETVNAIVTKEMVDDIEKYHEIDVVEDLENDGVNVVVVDEESEEVEEEEVFDINKLSPNDRRLYLRTGIKPS